MGAWRVLPCVEKWALTHDGCLEGTAVRGKGALTHDRCLEGSVVREVAVLAHGV